MVPPAPPPAPLPPATRVRNFLGWAFLISIGVHLVFGPFLGNYKPYTQQDKEIEKVSVTKKIRRLRRRRRHRRRNRRRRRRKRPRRRRPRNLNSTSCTRTARVPALPRRRTWRPQLATRTETRMGTATRVPQRPLPPVPRRLPRHPRRRRSPRARIRMSTRPSRVPSNRNSPSSRVSRVQSA